MAHRVTNKDQISIFDGLAIAYKRNDVWQFKCWLKDENKGVRRSLFTSSKTEAIKRAQQMYIDLMKNKDEGKRYFSITT